MIKKISVLVLVFVLGMTLLNKATFAQKSELIFKKLSVEDGLSHATAHHIMQDQRGFIWISTRDGLNRYDGQKFKVFNHEPGNPNSLSANMVWLTYADSNGLIWIGTSGGGLNVYDPQNNNFYRFLYDPEDKKSISGNTVISIFEDQQGTIWIGTDTGGLNKVVNKRQTRDGLKLEFKHYLPDSTDPQSISNATVMDIDQRNSRYLWIATYGGGINRLDIQKETFSTDYKIGGWYAMSVAVKGDQLWAGTKYNGLSLLNLEDNSLHVFRHDPNNPQSINSDFVWPVYIDREGIVWAGTFGDGLNKITINETEGEQQFSIESYKKDSADLSLLPGNSLLDIFQDNNDVLWIATDNTGISMFRKEIRFRTPEIDIVNSGLEVTDLKFKDFLLDDEGNCWIATASGLLFLPAGSKKARFISSGGGSKVVNALSKIDDDTILVGTNVGLYQIKETNRKLTRLPLSLPSGIATVDRVFDIVQSPTENIWLSTSTGLWKLNARLKVLDRFYYDPESPNTLSSTNTGTLFLEQDTLWVSTSTAGLNKLNIKTGKVKHFQQQMRESGSIGSNKILDMYRDETGRFWVAAFGGGLNELVYQDGKARFKKYLKEDGLPDNTVKHIEGDDNGNLWIITQKGLARFDINNEKIVPISVPIKNSNVNLNDIILYDNEFIITAAKGYRVFNPHDFLKQEAGPPLLLTDIQVNNKDYSIDNRYHPTELELSHEENFLTFEFSLLDYFSSNFASYYYKLEGLDRSWVHATNQNSVKYSALQPGEYTFRVKATSHDGTPASNQLALKFSILPPFWQTWWFRLAILTILVTVLWMIYRYRVDALLQVERTRRRIASDLHDDISTTLSSITYFARALRVEYPNLSDSKNLDLILDSSTDAKEKISDIVWSIDPEHDNWLDLLSRCRRYASDVFESKGINYKVDIVEEINKQVTVEQRKELWLIFKEIVTNVARHSQADAAQIIITYNNGILELGITDNGIGMEEDCFTKGKGLNNIKRRAAAIGAELSLNTNPGKGTEWKLQLRL